MKIVCDTDCFKYYNANYKGKKTDDCVIRALSLALNQDWVTTLRELTELGIKYGYVFNDVKTYGRYLESKGFTKHTQPRKRDNRKYTGKEFCKLVPNCIAHLGGHHIVCIKEGRVYDIWNSTRGCIGVYWVKG